MPGYSPEQLMHAVRDLVEQAVRLDADIVQRCSDMSPEELSDVMAQKRRITRALFQIVPEAIASAGPAADEVFELMQTFQHSHLRAEKALEDATRRLRDELAAYQHQRRAASAYRQESLRRAV